jgi:hypothetical protein
MTARLNPSTAVVAGAFALASCATTTFNATWKNPEAQPVQLAGARVAAVVVTPNDTARHAAEDALVRELNARGARGVASYSFLSTESLKEKDRDKSRAAAKGDFEKAGVDGAVVMRVVSADKEVTYQPGMVYTPGVWGSPYYGSFWGYYGGWGMAYDPGYLRTDTIVLVETTVYSLKQDKMLWGGMSETVNPSKADALMKELANGVAQEMRKAGLLQ